MNKAKKVALSGLEKTAILMNVLGEDNSFTLMKNMKDADVRRLLNVMGHMKKAPISLINTVLREFLFKISEKAFCMTTHLSTDSSRRAFVVPSRACVHLPSRLVVTVSIVEMA